MLHRIVEHGVILSSMLRGWDGISTGKNLSVTREPLKNGLIESIDICIFTGEDDALREVLVSRIGSLNVGIDGVNERGNSVFSTPKVVRKSVTNSFLFLPLYDTICYDTTGSQEA